MADLVENRSVRQRPEEGFRRWFVNDFFDLIVWYESARSEDPIGFQLCYDRHVNERAFTWQRGKRSSHYVSGGTDEAGYPWIATAVLHGDAGPVPPEVLDRFRREQGELPAGLLAQVVATVETYNRDRTE